MAFKNHVSKQKETNSLRREYSETQLNGCINMNIYRESSHDKSTSKKIPIYAKPPR